MGYYAPCPELTECHKLDIYWQTEQFDKFFAGYLKIARETGYALAECQVGFCYLDGVGVEKDTAQALYWTTRAARHGDRDGQFNLACIYEEGLCGEQDLPKALYWFECAARQDHDLAKEKCAQYGVILHGEVQ